jgi:hypothetical protein
MNHYKTVNAVGHNIVNVFVSIVIMILITSALWLWLNYAYFIIHILFQFQALQNITEKSKSWPLVVSNCAVQVDRVQLYLDRQFTFRCVLQSVLSQKSAYGQFPAKQQV